MSPSDAVRAFVAVGLDDAVRERMATLVADLRQAVKGGRWVRPEALHLTLRFLGATTPNQIRALGETLAAAARSCPPAEARVGGLGSFPPRGRPRVLWLGIELPPPVLELQAACEAAAVAAGFAPESRPFRAHLTLARFKTPVRLPELPRADLGATRLDTLHVVQSDLHPDGARYTVLDRYPFGPAE